MSVITRTVRDIVFAFPLTVLSCSAGWRASALIAGLVVLALPLPVAAHTLLHETTRADAVVVQFHYAGSDNKPSFEDYRVFAPGTEVAYQSGHVNADGEVSFRPNAPGEWRVRVASGDGHGAQVTVVVDEAGALQGTADGAGYVQRVLTALTWMFGLFGLGIVMRDMRRKRA